MRLGPGFLLLFVVLVDLGIGAVVLAGSLEVAGRASDQHGMLACGGRRRSFRLHLPPVAARRPAMPLVVVLHGGGGNGRAAERLTRFSALADSAGFCVAYPEAVNRHWNDGRGVSRYLAQRENVDDVGFIRALIDTLCRQLGLDRSRVYAAGISNGGMMCYRLALELDSRLAAVAPVAAAMPVNLAAPPGERRPVSVLAINGTADPFVPYEGGGVGLRYKRGVVRSVRSSVEYWVTGNGCVPVPETVWLEERDRRGRMRTRRETWRGGRAGSEVVLYTVEGGGHTWPGGTERRREFGLRTDDFDATRAIWEFFARHSR